MKVYILVHHYDEDFSHPFNDPVPETEIMDVYADEENAKSAQERELEKFKGKRGNHRFSIQPKEVKGLLA